MSDTDKGMAQETVSEFRRETNGQVVVVLQGGGALGAYQVGVYQALHEAGVEPDWIIGTSIGAINASIIAGNRPENRISRVNEFWKRIERPNAWPLMPVWMGISDSSSYWSTLANGIPGFFEPYLPAFWGSHVPLDGGCSRRAWRTRTTQKDVDFSPSGIRMRREAGYEATMRALMQAPWQGKFDVNRRCNLARIDARDCDGGGMNTLGVDHDAGQMGRHRNVVHAGSLRALRSQTNNL